MKVLEPVIRKTCRLVAAVVLGSVLCGPVRAGAAAQTDTLIFRRDSINISRGLLFPGADTVAISVAPDPMAPPAEPAVREILTPLREDRSTIAAVAPIPTAATYVAAGDSLHRRYDFAAAMEQYRLASQQRDADPAILALRMRTAQNGLNLSESVAAPVVIAKQRFSLKDFFLYYPMRPAGWRSAPNVLDKGGLPLVGATYVPRDAKTVFFSAADADGFRHLYMTQDCDSAWSRPALVDENLLSGGNEIYPMLSPDGDRLYFASDAFYGVGGYDLYQSFRDPETGLWGEPVNLGFPYSSPADDFLLMDTPDGKYTIFASNRACRSDSVYVYVLEHQALPFRSPAGSAEELRRLGALSPTASATRIDAASAIDADIPDDDNTRLFQEFSAEVSVLRDSVSVLERTLEILRGQLAATASGGAAGADALTGMATAIARQEETLSATRLSLDKAVKARQEAEKAFLKSGVRSRNRRTADREVVGAGSAYVFTKNSLGPNLKMRFDVSSTVAEATPSDVFRVAPVGRFSPTSVLPNGIVYQIYLFTSPRHASLDDINGLTPVYERMTTSLKYTYSVGVFFHYSAALSALPSVRRLGFPEASIIAFRNNAPIPVIDARRLSDR